jgi:hypothetical protein
MVGGAVQRILPPRDSYGGAVRRTFPPRDSHGLLCQKKCFLIGLIDALIMKNLLKTMRFEVSLGNSTLMKLTFR